MITEKDMYGVKIFDGIENQKLYTEPNCNIKTLFNCKKKYHTEGEIELCKNGYHFSPTLKDALEYKEILNREKKYLTINPVFIVKIPKGSEIKYTSIFSENEYGNLIENAIKAVSSDIEFYKTISFSDILYYLHSLNIIKLRNILYDNDSIDISEVSSFIYIRKYNSKGISIEASDDLNYNRSTFFINRQTLSKEILENDNPLKIINKTKYTQYLNIVDDDRQYIVNIPRYSSKTIESSLLLSSECDTIIVYPDNIPEFF